jgi:hypothetical protein
MSDQSYLVIGGELSSDWGIRLRAWPGRAHPPAHELIISPGCNLTGEGFLGSTLVKALLNRYPGSAVSSLDLVQRHFPEKSAWTFYSADLTNLSQLAKAIKQSGATTVFHTASPWTGSGKEVCEKVNVQGTQTIVDACLQEGVKQLVFTSSAGTVYNGEDLINVDERMPFPTVELDSYNVTKVSRMVRVWIATRSHGARSSLLRGADHPSRICRPRLKLLCLRPTARTDSRLSPSALPAFSGKLITYTLLTRCVRR